MNYKSLSLIFFCVLFNFLSAQSLVELNRYLVEQTVNDKLSPPVASRTLAYCNLAYYYGLNFNEGNDCLIRGIESKRNVILINDDIEDGDIDKEILAVKLFLIVANYMSYNQTGWIKDLEHSIDNKLDHFYVDMLDERFNKLIESDNFFLRDREGAYILKKGEFEYDLTPPKFQQPVESNWELVKPFLIDELDDYLVDNIDLLMRSNKNKFKRENKRLYSFTKKISDAKIESAKLWDCNPVKTRNIGHTKLLSFRMTPGAHWISILNDISDEEIIDAYTLAKIYTYLSVSMSDGFVIVWKNKYRDNFIRPITYIHDNIDPKWKPLLESPYFPEYPSGHSSISMLAAGLLTEFFGDDFEFIDKTQLKFSGIEKKFSSFKEAAIDAGMSRYYGGIHYKRSILDGFNQGNLIKEKICLKLNL